jgi:transcriptional regulator with XRE-family HTH domain
MEKQLQLKLWYTIFALRDHMQENGIRIKDVSDKTGIDKANVSRILSGKVNPTLTTYIQIREAIYGKGR